MAPHVIDKSQNDGPWYAEQTSMHWVLQVSDINIITSNYIYSNKNYYYFWRKEVVHKSILVGITILFFLLQLEYYLTHCPPRLNKNGDHRQPVQIRIRAKDM